MEAERTRVISMAWGGGGGRRHNNQSVQGVSYARCVILKILLYNIGAIVNDTVLYSII